MNTAAERDGAYIIWVCVFYLTRDDGVVGFGLGCSVIISRDGFGRAK